MQFSFSIGDLAILISGLVFLLGMKSSIDGLKKEIRALRLYTTDIMKNHIAPLNEKYGKVIETLDIQDQRMEKIETIVAGLSESNKRASDGKTRR